MSRIAVFRALQLGDLLVAVPALRSLRAGFPEAEISLIGLPWAVEFARRFGHYVDRFVAFPGYPGLIETDPEPEAVERFSQAERAYGYDLALQLHGSGTVSNQVIAELGAGATAGFYDGDPPAHLTVAVPYPDLGPEVLRNLELVHRLGCPDRGVELEFPLFTEDRREAASLLEGLERPIVGLHAGARSPARRWPAEHFAAAADALSREMGATIVLTGAESERATVQEVEARMERPTLNLAGRTSLGGLGGVIASCDLFISNDTGPAHIAVAVDTPSVTIFGAADPNRWAPLDSARHPIVRHPVPCSPCVFWECPIDHPCLRQLPPDAVLAAAGLLLAGVSA